MGLLDNIYDIIIIGETWLTSRMHSEEYFPADFIVYRKDKYDFDTSLKGGGVLIAVKNAFPSELIARHPTIDAIAVRVKGANMSVVLVGVYVIYGSTIDYYNALISFIDSDVMPLVRVNDHLMIIGDFNLPDIIWFDVDGLLTSSSTDEKAIVILDYFAGLSTTQLNRISNSRNKFLDLLFSNELLFSEVSACEDFMGCTSVHHTPLMINIFYCKNSDNINLANNFHFNYSKADFASLDEFLQRSDWRFLQRGCDLNDAVLLLNKLLNTGIERCVPLVKHEKSFREPWYNKELVILEKRRNKLHTLYRIHGAEFYSAFVLARRDFKNLNWFLYNNYILRIEEGLTSNPKKFWKFLNNKKKVHGFPSSMRYLSSTASSSTGICDLFASFFASVYEPASPFHSVSLNNFSRSSFNHLSFTVEEVYNCLCQLDVTKGAGHDRFPPILFKNCAKSLALPISFIFNESLRRGFFPDPWKISVIHPIFKSGKRNEISSYRGIAILSVVPKLFESMVHKFLSFHLRPYISPEQHGFFSGRSTVTNLVSLCGVISKTVSSKLQLDVIYTDFAKAFDKIDHAILAAKLESLNCEFIPIKWLLSYLSDRLQFVKIFDSSSRHFRASSGVPQGSHIGPLLFTIFVNDVVKCFKFAKCLLFADDMKIFASISNVSDCQSLQRDLVSFCNWSINNKLFLNVSKCKAISFYRMRSPLIQNYFLYDNTINRVECLTDLGVIFTFDFTFNRHFDYIINKANIMLGFIKRNCYDFCDPLTLKTLYVAFVRSVLEYASPVWNPFYRCHSDRIESVQKRFILYALRRLPNNHADQYILPPYQDRCSLLRLQRLDVRRDVASLMLAYDVLLARASCAELLARFNVFAPERCLRRRDGFLRTDTVLTNYGLSEPVLNIARLFNAVYHVFDFHVKRNSFRDALHKFFTETD